MNVMMLLKNNNVSALVFCDCLIRVGVFQIGFILVVLILPVGFRVQVLANRNRKISNPVKGMFCRSERLFFTVSGSRELRLYSDDNIYSFFCFDNSPSKSRFFILIL